MAAGSKILAAVFVSLKRNIIDDIISPERARLLTVGVVCINREYEFLEDDELDNCEDIIDFAEEHQMKKIIRSKSIARQKNICSKRYKKIANRTCIPSIYVGFFWNSDGTELLNKPYISYGKNSRLQQCLKRATNKKLRQISTVICRLREIITEKYLTTGGLGYRKRFAQYGLKTEHNKVYYLSQN